MNFDIKSNIYNFKINDLIEVGKRTNNEKRNFLFISKLLGKHIIVRPDIVKATGVLLASLKYPEIDAKNIVRFIKGEDMDISCDLMQESNPTKNVLVIGFAETATGLGMAVASAIKNCTYQTTTREPISGMHNLFSFEEEHCHATTHQCFSLLDKDFDSYEEIILVDDEITTGKTMLNLITELRKVTHVKNFSILTILDWRVKEYLNYFNDYLKENDVNVKVYSVMSGFATNSDSTVYYDTIKVDTLDKEVSVINLNMMDKVKVDTLFGEKAYFKNSGRFGVKQNLIKALEDKAKKIATKINVGEDEKVLILGHGECIYIPSRVASYLHADYRTTTRSPIYCDGITIKTKHSFLDRDVTYYFYNKDEIESKYDRVILLTETDLDVKLCENFEIYKI